jgi:carbon-monoxide dehydrogenase large subunit
MDESSTVVRADAGEAERPAGAAGTGGESDPSDEARHLGKPLKRREDRPLITGQGEYTDDIQPPETAHVAFVRSRYGHARIENVDTSAAEAVDGVLTVLTGEDLAADDRVTPAIHPDEALPNQVAPAYPLMPADVARFTGDALAMVVAEDRYAAADGADAVAVDYDRLDAVVDGREALAEGAPTLHEDAPDNCGLDWEFGTDAERVEATFAEAAHTVSVETHNQRLHPDAMEPRAVLAEYDDASDDLTVHMAAQAPFLDRGLLAGLLGFEAEDVRVVAPDVGGGFGSKCLPYPEQALVAWASMRTGRPTKWVATRTESHAADHHGRDFHTEGEFALDAEGNVLAFRTDAVWNIGAYLVFATSPAPNFETLASGAYAIPEIHGHLRGAFTNTSPVAPYRGAGRPEIIHLIERLMDEAAAELGVDPAEIRRRNYIGREEFPYDTPVSAVYDSGDYEPTLDLALEGLDYEGWRERQREAREDGRYLGIGIATFVENTGTGPGTPETGKVELRADGTAVATTGTADHGQGHATAFSQLVAEELGLTPEDVEVRASDTDLLEAGAGTFGSRSVAVGGSALAESAREVRSEILRLAARHFGVTTDDVTLVDGELHVEGSPERSLSLSALLAETGDGGGAEGDLSATTVFDPEDFEYSFGTHAAVVEVDPDSGEIAFHRYVAVDDCGTQFNSMIVEGQVMGGVAQGIGQALFEHARYDDNGTLTSGSLQDYALPKAMQVPDMELDETETPSPRTPTGAKGAGEGGAIVAPPTVVNAVIDALRPLGVDSLEMPLTEERVWRAVAEAGDDA